MKKIYLLSELFNMLIFNFWSCEKEDTTEVPVYTIVVTDVHIEFSTFLIQT